MSSEEQNIQTINKSTTITLGLAVTILMAILGGIAAGAWWAATISGKMDYVTTTASENRQRIVLLESTSLRADHIRPIVREIVHELMVQRAFEAGPR